MWLVTESSKAEEIDPADPVYPSNLSAALYEAGDYLGSVNAIVRSWRVVKGNEEGRETFLVRLATRLARALCHGVSGGKIVLDTLLHIRGDLQDLKAAAWARAEGPAKEDMHRVWNEWTAVESDIDTFASRRDTCLQAFSRLPIFCKPL